jgi:hypothetical protein
MQKLSDSIIYKYDQSLQEALAYRFVKDTEESNKDRFSDFEYSLSRNKGYLSNVTKNFFRSNELLFSCSENLKKFPFYLPIVITPQYSLINLYPFEKSCDNKVQTSVKTQQLLGLSSAAIFMRHIVLNQSSYEKSTRLMGVLAGIYGRLIAKSIDKSFSINLFPLIEEQIKFLASYYFLKRVATISSKDDEEIIQLCKNNIRSTTLSSSSVITILSVFNTKEGFLNFTAFNNELEKVFYSRLRGLTPNVIIANTAKLFGERMILSIDYLPYLVANIIFYMSNSLLNNEFSLEKILGNDILIIPKELNRISGY